ncbi:MAG TPA: electron-transfer flavoprotein:ubiquinone oxidoreductase [Gaiellaceae bacterium]|nr:electron-transfer flavoprotein:ubiquinone oxidoreductase [Gaiellaceae bacterium]
MRPSDFPPPWSDGEAIAGPSDSDPIEVGVLVVGAGPAGLAAAIRLGMLAAADPEGASRLGEIPVAVLEKGKAPGSHLLSGAVIDPGPLHRLLEGLRTPDELPSYGEVPGESVLFLTPGRAVALPIPPTMRNHGNVIVSLSRLGRWLGEAAEEIGTTVLAETAAQALLVEDGRVVGVRTGDKGLGRRGERLARFEAGSEIRAQVTVLAEGTAGHLTTAALERFALGGACPQTWALGVKEVWRVPRPLRKVIHTMGWPLRSAARFREFGGSFLYPMGEEMVTIGMVVGLDYRDGALSVHDLLQELKCHPRIRPLLEGGERVAWGAKTIPEGGFVALPRRLHAPGLLVVGDGAGLVNVPALKGIHYAVESGRLAAEAAWSSLAGGELAGFDEALRRSFVWRDLREVRNMRQAFGSGFWRGSALAGLATVSKGRLPAGDRPTELDAGHEIFSTERALSYPAADGVLTFDKLSSVFLSGNRTRDDQPSHIRVATAVPAELGELWSRMCPAQVYEVGPGEDGLVEVKVSASNCVQCGAITAKGGRLTPPDGGSGPEYTLT